MNQKIIEQKIEKQAFILQIDELYHKINHTETNLTITIHEVNKK